MAKYIKVTDANSPSFKMAVCEVCGKKFLKISSANACEARHFFNREKPIKEAGKCEETKAYCKEM